MPIEPCSSFVGRERKSNPNQYWNIHKLSSCSYAAQYTIISRFATKITIDSRFYCSISKKNSSKGLSYLTDKVPAVLFLAFMLGATSSWAMDVDDEDAATDAPVKTQDVDAKPTIRDHQ
jgi:hypothetical protein